MRNEGATICRGIRPSVRVVVGLLAVVWPAVGVAQAPAPAPLPTREAPRPSFDESLTALDPRWSLTFETPPAVPAGFDDSAAYLPLRSGDLVAVELDTGKVRWRQALETLATPATGDGRVYAGSNGAIVALDATTGRTLWRTPLPGRLAAPLHWDTGWLLASTDAGDLAAFRATDGTLVWRAEVGSPLVATPAPALDKLYLPLDGGRVRAVDLGTGAQAWEQTFQGNISGLLALDDQLVVGTTGNEVYSLDLTRGRVRWRWRVGADVAGRATADARHIYFVARDNVVRAVDRRNGNLRWSKPLASRPASGPLRAGDLVLVPYVSTQVAVFDARTGTPLPPIVVAGELGTQPQLRPGARPTAPRLFTVSRDGMLQAFAARVEPPPAPLSEPIGARATP